MVFYTMMASDLRRTDHVYEDGHDRCYAEGDHD